MSISPINDTRVQLDALKIDSSEPVVQQDVAASTAAAPQPLTDQEILKQDVWADSARLFGLDAVAGKEISGVPSTDTLARMATDVVSFLT